MAKASNVYTPVHKGTEFLIIGFSLEKVAGIVHVSEFNIEDDRVEVLYECTDLTDALETLFSKEFQKEYSDYKIQY